jgi:mRNA interferase MazF
MGTGKTEKQTEMIFSKGDIVIIPVPFTDNEVYKFRPAIVISDDDVHRTGDVMIVQITSKLKQDNLSISITNDDVTENLPVKSYIRVHKIFVLEQKLIKGKVSSLRIDKYKELIERIKQIID